jgi:DNA-binding MarR family transcriptional regulator
MDAEARLHDDDHAALRLWLRLFTCSQLVEQRIRGKLREEFGTTLPRFDLMAQLERAPLGLRMNELSQRMMVTNGNVTGITDQLVGEGLVERCAVPGDKRAFRVRLTPKGRTQFHAMARAHERWIVECFQSLSAQQIGRLHSQLARLKQGLKTLKQQEAA